MERTSALHQDLSRLKSILNLQVICNWLCLCCRLTATVNQMYMAAGKCQYVRADPLLIILFLGCHYNVWQRHLTYSIFWNCCESYSTIRARTGCLRVPLIRKNKRLSYLQLHVLCSVVSYFDIYTITVFLAVLLARSSLETCFVCNISNAYWTFWL